MSRHSSDEIYDLWDSDPQQITEEEAISHSLQRVREYEQRFKAQEKQNLEFENQIEILRKAIKARDKNFEAQQKVQQKRIESLELENQALQKALVAQEKLNELQNQELNFELDLSLVELQLLVHNGFEEIEAENIQFRTQLKALDEKLKALQEQSVESGRYVLELSIPVKAVDQTIRSVLETKGGDQDDSSAEV